MTILRIQVAPSGFGPEFLFPNAHILLEALAALPVTKMKVECSFFTLQHLKTYLIAVTSNEQLL